MISKIIPQLPSLDLARTEDFYTRKLGFTLKRRYDGFLILMKDDLELHFWHCHEPLIPQNSSVYCHVDNIDELYGECERQGIVHPNAHLEDKPWGIKEFYAVDPDGNLIKFGQVAFR